MDLDFDSGDVAMKSDEDMLREKGLMVGGVSGGGGGLPGNHNHYSSKSKADGRRMVDITRDKPIKVAVRVVVPVRDHPKFNFVGKLLGPKGNSLKRLQEDTMCKMAVLGRGSMKDRHKEEELRASGDPKFQHLSEELHVEISAFATPAEAHARIAYALAEVRRFLVPDYNDDIRQEQMWEMQVLSSQRNNGGGAGVGGGNGNNSGLGGNGNSNNNNVLGAGKDGEMSGGSSTGGGEYHLVGGGGSGGGTGGLDDRLSAGGDDMPDSPPCGKEMDHPALRGLQQSLVTGCSESLLLGSCGGINGGVGGGGGCVGGNNGNSTCPSNCGAAVTLTAHCIGNTSPVNGSTASMAGGLLVSMPSSGTSTCAQSQSPPGGSINASPATSIPGRKRPLLAGGPRASMTPTKRTVMSLLARARAAQAKHLPASVNATHVQTYPRTTTDSATLVPVLREDFVTGSVNLNLI